jgi:hypothetical protein
VKIKKIFRADQRRPLTPKEIINNIMEAPMDISSVPPEDPSPRRRYQRRGSVTEHTLRAQQIVLASMMGPGRTQPTVHPSVPVASHPCQPISEDSFHLSQDSIDHVSTRRPSSTSTISGDCSISSLLSASGQTVGSFGDTGKESTHGNKTANAILSGDRMDCQ